MIVPCLECGERSPGCHGRCEDYEAYRKSYELITEYQRKYRNDAATQVLIEGTIRNKRK